MSDFFDLIKRRESCRNYSDRPVEREKLLACLEAARLSPSACNSQPWRFTAVTDPEKIALVAEAVQRLGINRFAPQVPVFVVVTEEKAKLLKRIAELVCSQHFSQIDVGLAAAHFVLAATQQGLSTCILGMFDEEKLKSFLPIPESSKVRLVLCVGYSADEKPREKSRKPLEEISQIV